MVDNGFEFGIGVDAEADFANHDVAVGLGVERLHRQPERIGDTVHQVYEQMAAVHGTYPQGDRVQ